MDLQKVLNNFHQQDRFIKIKKLQIKYRYQTQIYIKKIKQNRKIRLILTK